MIHLSPPKKSGTKVWCHLTADSESELRRAAERLHEEIHGKGVQEQHLDLPEKKRKLALQYGAREED